MLQIVLLGCTWLLMAVQMVNAVTTTRYVTSYCNTQRSIYVNDSIILELTNQILEDRITKSIHCASVIETDKSRRLLLHFISLDISNENNSPDSLHFYDMSPSGELKRLTPTSGLYGLYDRHYSHTSSGVGDYMSSGNRLKLQYQGSPTLTYRGFKLLVTAFRDDLSDGTCSGLYGHCPGKGICVPFSVWCDGDSNCGQGDESDENICNQVVSAEWEYNCVTIMASVTALVAIVMFLLTVLTVACILRRYNRRNYMRRRSIVVKVQRNDKGKLQITNDMGLTLSMAPPMYEEVVGSEDDEPPPAYDTVTHLMQSHSARNSVQSVNGYTVVECHITDGEVVCQPISAIANPHVADSVESIDFVDPHVENTNLIDSHVDISNPKDSRDKNISSSSPKVGHIHSANPHMDSFVNENNQSGQIYENIGNGLIPNREIDNADDNSLCSSSDISSSSELMINNNDPKDKTISNGKVPNGNAIPNGLCNGDLDRRKVQNGTAIVMRQQNALPMDDEIEYIDEEGDDDEISH
ncbi:hypothetical protein FSP39_004458 [Pinctada imbricata]|uniref:CUB domain-containing protein n=1 Tax=Pinctada imbricata TaxID=66713 RepID=A0AA88YPU6_PINIB|nr:hypothetical protein FSP39_004458 [Pinctada imbricata]